MNPMVLQRASQAYVERALPLNADAERRRDTKRAYYAGARAVLEALVTVAAEPGTEPTAEEVRLVEYLDTELKNFAIDMKNGRA